jgi:alpha-glucosidase
VSVQEADPESVLALYRAALRLRHELLDGESLEWAPSEADVVRFRRPGGWEVVTNFGAQPVALPEGEVLLASGPVEGGLLDADTTVWLRSAR